MKLPIPLLLSAALLCGCRTAGPQIDLTGAHHIVIRIRGSIDADLGKSTPMMLTAPVSQAGPAIVEQPRQTVVDVPTPEPDGTEEPGPAPVDPVPDPE